MVCRPSWRHTGDPLAFASVQGAWKRELQDPPVTLPGPIMLAGKIQAELAPGVMIASSFLAGRPRLTAVVIGLLAAANGFMMAA
jgi:hypothetical protein